MHFKNVFNIDFINQSYRKHETFFFLWFYHVSFRLTIIRVDFK